MALGHKLRPDNDIETPSGYLGEFLAQPGSRRDRWFTLPGFRRLTPDADIEDDLEARQTALAVGRRGVRRY